MARFAISPNEFSSVTKMKNQIVSFLVIMLTKIIINFMLKEAADELHAKSGSCTSTSRSKSISCDSK